MENQFSNSSFFGLAGFLVLTDLSFTVLLKGHRGEEKVWAKENLIRLLSCNTKHQPTLSQKFGCYGN